MSIFDRGTGGTQEDSPSCPNEPISLAEAQAALITRNAEYFYMEEVVRTLHQARRRNKVWIPSTRLQR